MYLQNGVLTPEEVARSRFRPEGWSAETEVDIAARPSPGAPDDDPPPAPSLPAASDAPPAEQEGLAAPARSGMGGAGGPTKPAGLLPIVPANTEGE